MPDIPGARLRLELFPADLNQFADFYCRVLRFELVTDDRITDDPYVAVRRGDVRIGAAPAWQSSDPAGRLPPAGTEIVLEVADLDEEMAHVRACGWPLQEEITLREWGLRDFRLLDPDGYFIRVTHEP